LCCLRFLFLRRRQNVFFGDPSHGYLAALHFLKFTRDEREVQSVSRRTLRPKSAAHPGIPLDAVGREALELFARAFARCGFAPSEAARLFREISEHLPAILGRHGTGSSTQSDEAAHVLTLWFTEPEYLMHGEPRPLFLRGSAPSIENLVRRIQPGPGVDAVMEYLLATRTVRRIGRRYIPRARAVRHRGAPRSQSAHSLRILLGLLRNVEHNARPRRAGPSWPEFTADCPHFPVRLRSAFNIRAERDALAMTRQKDAEMRRAESSRRPGAPTVPLSFGVYVFEGGRPRTK
jgi:hypothetical protein